MDIIAMVLSVGLCAILLIFLVVNLFSHKENDDQGGNKNGDYSDRQ